MTWKVKPEVTVGNILMMLSIAGGFTLWATSLQTRLAITDTKVESIEKQMEARDRVIDQMADDIRWLVRKEGKKD